MNTLVLWGVWTCCLTNPLLASTPWADAVIDWQPGIGGVPGYDNPSNALGPPETFSGEGFDPGVVSPFQPAWGPDELVSLGAGGSLVLWFEDWIEDHPDNRHGIDLIVFGNAGFIDGSYPYGIVNGLFGADGGDVSLSDDGQTWYPVPGCLADDAWPTLAWLDADPYDDVPGLMPTNPTIPMDPDIDWTELIGSGWDAILETYGESAGGVGIDLADMGLERVRYLRIEVPETALLSPEIDAVVDVPPELPADLDGDGLVDVSDLLLLLASWGPVVSEDIADLDDNGIVDVTDLLLLLEAWTP